jgi:hypothetical protein
MKSIRKMTSQKRDIVNVGLAVVIPAKKILDHQS